MKISADLTTFEIVLFKSTMACIHTYFISIALCMPREAMGIIYVDQEERERERDKGKERQRQRQAHSGRETALTPNSLTDYAGQKPERYALD